MKWCDHEIQARMMRTKPIWHRQLVRIARRKSWRPYYIADIACGATGLLPRLFRGKWRATCRPILGIGVDSNAEVILRAQKQAVDSRLPLFFMQADMRDLSCILPLSFDIVFCWETFYLLTDSQLNDAIRWIKRILHPDGILICGATGPRMRPDPILDPYCRVAEKKIRPYRATWRTVDEYLHFLRQNGLDVEYQRIYVSEHRYQQDIASIPPQRMYFRNEPHMHEYYTKVGKSVWICRHAKRGSPQ